MYLNKLLKVCKCLQITNTRSLQTESLHAKLLVNMLGLKPIDAQKYIVKNKLYELECHRLSDAIDFFKTANYEVHEVLNKPKLFQLCHTRTWEQYYLVLQQCGILNITINNLLNYKKIMYSTVIDLKKANIIPRNSNVAINLVKYLKPVSKDFPIDDFGDGDMLKYILYNVIRRYLIYRLDATDEDINCLFRMHRFIYNKSLVYLCENIDFALELGYSKEKILRNGYILNAHPRNTKEVLNTIPDFVGTNMRREMKLYPKLIGISLQRFLTTYDILKKYNVTDDLIRKSMNIFTLKPSTVEERLESIKNTPEIRVLMNNPRVMRLLIHYNLAKTRLSFMQNLKLKCASLKILGDVGNAFDEHIKEGKDVNKTQEIGVFLKALLNSNDEQIEVDIKKHALYLNVPFIQMEETFLFLKRRHFNRKHIAKCVQILLYPIDKITKILDQINNQETINTVGRIKKEKILNVALYYLEKEYHFTGNGIWNDTRNTDEQL